MTVRTADGRRQDVYLGRYDSPESLEEYRRVLAQIASGQPAPAQAPKPSPQGTVAELMLAFLTHAREAYRDSDGKPTTTYHRLVGSLRKLRELYAHTPVADFGPRDLKAVRAALVAGGLSRKGVNSRVQTVKRLFKFGVAEEIVPPAVYQRLQAVDGLRAGRTEAPDPQPVGPAPAADVEAAVAYMPPAAAAIVRLQRMTGARCGELCVLRPRDIDRTDPAAWSFTPAGHKGTWRDKARTVYLGRRCQDVLAPFLLKAGDPDAFVFSPAREEAERNANRGAKRVTKKWPSHMKRNAKKRGKPRRTPFRQRYITQTIRQAIGRACERAGCRCSPRTNSGTWPRRKSGPSWGRRSRGRCSATPWPA